MNAKGVLAWIRHTSYILSKQSQNDLCSNNTPSEQAGSSGSDAISSPSGTSDRFSLDGSTILMSSTEPSVSDHESSPFQSTVITKRINKLWHLLALEKPVRFESLQRTELGQKLEKSTASNLYQDVCMEIDKQGIALKELRNTLSELFGYNVNDSRWDSSFTSDLEKGFSEPKVRRLAEELCQGMVPIDISRRVRIDSEHGLLNKIVATSLEHSTTKYPEWSWNTNIYFPLLKLAVEGFEEVVVENTEELTIFEAYQPRWKSSPQIQLSSEMITCTMCFEPEPESKLKLLLEEFISGLQQSTFNPTTFTKHDVLRFRPCGVAIVANTNASADSEAGVQLGVWLAAWFKRMSSFSPETTFIPAIIIEGSVWNLWFAFDEGDQIIVYGSLHIGDSDDMESIYILLSTLRVLARWMCTDFKDWVEKCVEIAEDALDLTTSSEG